MLVSIAIQGIEKQAVSVGRTLAALRGRVAQGAAVAPAILRDVERQAATGAASTPANVRGIALRAAEDVGSKRKLHESLNNPVVQSARQRLLSGYESAVQRSPGVFDRNTPLPYHYDHGAAGMTSRPVAYAKGHVEQLVGPSQVKDPKGLLSPAVQRVKQRSANSTAVTMVDRR